MLPIANGASHMLGKCRCLTRAEKETISGSEDPDKCKELRISFARNPVELDAVVIDRKEVKGVSTAKLLGLTISANLTLKKQLRKLLSDYIS